MDNVEIEDLLSSLGPVSIRRMFSGKGIYHHGVIFALYLFDELMLKADDETAPLFQAVGSRQWVYQREGRNPVAMPYWAIPDDAYDDPDEMAKWVRLAYEAGLRAEATKSKPTRKPRASAKIR
ncbi:MULTISPECIES: TfoX/Sxy family protein [Alphaproteobacteria]|uniref:Competence protein TfoX n=2 Tax=Alphaproteobacteria TaxID=28211 RepID=A0A512HCP0_9HYPH|nr:MULTISPECIES: TfoX/Sxy family protein [Alphaproteobacteria]GEO83214.1 competence protein TfoX [Ciceribacter naphthalenivorans]GLR20391.1 competence protein TfoX [Ciceribacter naphthalenivorans]GLT03247.1 competence protein TfoX [Sphingomonas psychrolutea]